MIRETRGEFDSTSNTNPKKISYELYEPKSDNLHAAVVILPGTFGLLPPWGEDIKSFAKGLAEQGNVAIILNYFDRTSSVPGLETTSNIGPLTQKHGDTWISAIEDGIFFIADQQNVDAKRIGLLGFSLGGNRALIIAINRYVNVTIKKLVEFFSPITLIPLSGDVSLLPKLQIHHGDNTDVVVPPSESARLISDLKSIGKVEGVDFDMFEYPGAGHGFEGDDLKRSREETIKFFNDL